MQNTIRDFVIIAASIVVAICQIKQAYFPVMYPSNDEYAPGIEVPNDVEEIDENSPLFKAVVDAYERAKQFKPAGAFLQQIIDDTDGTGVEIITDKEEMEGY